MNKNIQWQYFKVIEKDRARIKDQFPLCIWMTGLSGSGKSTIANQLDLKLNLLGKHSYILDGDNLRHGLNSDLDFGIQGRNENVRRAAEVARLMVDAGLIVIVSLISPLKKERDFARNLFKKDQFREVYISTPLKECENRDVKGLYKKARLGQIKDFTGIDSPYEEPLLPDIKINTTKKNIDDCVEQIIERLF